MFKRIALMLLLVMSSHSYSLFPAVAIGATTGALGGVLCPLIQSTQLNDAGQASLFRGLVVGMLAGCVAGGLANVTVMPSIIKPVAGMRGFSLGLLAGAFSVGADVLSKIKIFPA